MQDLRLVLIIMGGVAIAALLLHGLWASRKEQPSKFKDNPIKKLKNDENLDSEGFDQDGIGKVTVVQPEIDAVDTQTEMSEREPNLNMDFSEPSIDDDFLSMSATDEADNSTHTFDDNVDLSISIEQAELKANFEKQKEAALRVKELQTEDSTQQENSVDNTQPTTQAESNNEKLDAEAESEKVEQTSENELVMVLHVHAPKDEVFDGIKLFSSMELNGLRFGEMSIFHRYADLLDDKKVLFSVANSVNPGTFDVNNNDFTTPSISFFMALPCYGEAEQNFKLMLQTAQKIAGDLGGTVQDQKRRMITPQKIDEYRAQVRNFQQD